MIKRPLYLNELMSYVDKPFIKVLAGVRRAGKSSLLQQIYDELVAHGVDERRIALINFDSIDYTEIRDKAAMVELLKGLLRRRVHYFLLDEVQNVANWDEVVSALYAEPDTDVFITGSNSKLLSSELSTFFTGRYVGFRVHTLNFEETREFRRALFSATGDVESDFAEYLARGGFPSLYLAEQTEAQDDAEVTDIYNSIMYRDLVERKNVRNTELLRRITQFVFDNIGSPVSAKSISDYLKSERMSCGLETVYNYLNWLEEALVIERVQRADLRGKEILKTQEKYYLSDVGLLYAINGRSRTYLSGALENVAYHELASHGHKVYIGKNGDKEIDFVAEKDRRRMYIQVAAYLADRETVEREFGAFAGITDGYPKYVLTLDRDWDHEQDGIRQMYLPEFLLKL